MQHKTLFAGALSAFAGVASLNAYMNEFEKDVLGGEFIPVLVLSKDSAPGSALTQAMLHSLDLPERFVESRHIRADDKQRIVGMKLSVPGRAGESLLWSDLSGMQNEGRMLSTLVPEGMRAMPISVARGTLQRLLRPGDVVDVLHTERHRTNITEHRSDTVTLLQKVLVLAVGSNLDSESEARGRSSKTEVTLSVSPSQSHVLADASRMGSLHLTLRNPDDTADVVRAYGKKAPGRGTDAGGGHNGL